MKHKDNELFVRSLQRIGFVRIIAQYLDQRQNINNEVAGNESFTYFENAIEGATILLNLHTI